MALQKMRFWRNWNFLAISQFQLSHLTCNFLHLFSRSLTLLLSLSLLFYTSFRNHQFFRLNVFPSELLWRLNLTSCNKQQLSDSCTCLCVCVWVCVNYMHFLSFYNLQVCCYSLPPSSVFHYARMFTHTAHPPRSRVESFSITCCLLLLHARVEPILFVKVGLLPYYFYFICECSHICHHRRYVRMSPLLHATTLQTVDCIRVAYVSSGICVCVYFSSLWQIKVFCISLRQHSIELCQFLENLVLPCLPHMYIRPNTCRQQQNNSSKSNNILCNNNANIYSNSWVDTDCLCPHCFRSIIFYFLIICSFCVSQRHFVLVVVVEFATS